MSINFRSLSGDIDFDQYYKLEISVPNAVRMSGDYVLPNPDIPCWNCELETQKGKIPFVAYMVADSRKKTLHRSITNWTNVDVSEVAFHRGTPVWLSPKTRVVLQILMFCKINHPTQKWVAVPKTSFFRHFPENEKAFKGLLQNNGTYSHRNKKVLEISRGSNWKNAIREIYQPHNYGGMNFDEVFFVNTHNVEVPWEESVLEGLLHGYYDHEGKLVSLID